jgi:lysine 6-dehydrogenase
VKILLLGCGRIGRYIYDVLSTKHEVVAVDKAKSCPAAVQQDALEVPLGGYDIVINALPGNVVRVVSRHIKAGLDAIFSR